MSRDPIGYRAGHDSLYSYVGNCPTTAVDPTGLVAISAQDCKNAREKALSGFAEQLDAMKMEGCPRPPIKCLCCVDSTLATTVYEAGKDAAIQVYTFDGTSRQEAWEPVRVGDILVCYNNLGRDFAADTLHQAIHHELVHAYDSCFGLDHDDCEQFVCSEARAYSSMGACDDGGVYRKQYSYETREKCIFEMTKRSARKKESACHKLLGKLGGGPGYKKWLDLIAATVRKCSVNAGGPLPDWPYPSKATE